MLKMETNERKRHELDTNGNKIENEILLTLI